MLTKPTVPLPALRSQRETFDARAEASVAFFTALREYMDGLGDFVAAKAGIADVVAAGGAMPSFAEHLNNFFRVNASETGLEFDRPWTSYTDIYQTALTTEALRTGLAVKDSYSKLLQLTANSSTSLNLNFSSQLGPYKKILIEVQDLVPTTDGALLYLRTSSDNGVSYAAAASDYSNILEYRNQSTGATLSTRAAAAAFGQLSAAVGSATDEWGYSGLLSLNLPVGATNAFITGQSCWTDNAGVLQGSVCSSIRRNSTAAITALQIIASSGTLKSGKVRIYGIR